MGSGTSHLYRRLHSGLSYRLRSLAGGRFAHWCRPVSIGLLISERCNARCVHCDIWKNRGQENSPGAEGWKTMLRDLAQWLGPVHVVISGGEALLRPWTHEVIAYGSSLGLYIEVLTHGYWMDQTRIEQMAMARPGRVTVSVDGIGEMHSRIRGREKFWEYTLATLENLSRLRSERKLGFDIRLKTVIMDQNVDGVAEVAHFAAARDMEVFYQAIEQNYNTAEDPEWFLHSPTWPKDTERCVRAVEEIIALKRRGSPVANSFAQLRAMIPYFRDPDAMRVRIQSHSGHEKAPLCATLTTIQAQSNGDITVCCARPPVGNIMQSSIREIWRSRPAWWNEGCCLTRRFSDAEKQESGLAIVR